MGILDNKALNLTIDKTKEAMKQFKHEVVGIRCLRSTICGALEADPLAKQKMEEIVTWLRLPL